MAPSIPVYSKREIQGMFPNALGPSDVGDMKESGCELKELVQNQCTFDGNTIFCLPFKRVFLRCLDESLSDGEVIGYKLTPSHATIGSANSANSANSGGSRWRNFEITQHTSNEYNLQTKNVQDFIHADEVLRRQMEKYYNRYVYK